MAKKIKVQTCKFVPVSSLVPDSWGLWFYDAITQDAPFSWGDNNRTMITAQRFYGHCWSRIRGEGYVNEGAFKSWLKKIDRLPPDMLIDLEN
jgi:hypothetical protein